MVQLDTFANIATIFLIIEALVILVVLLAVSFGLARAMMLVRRKVVEVMPQIQGQARRLADTSESVSQKVAVALHPSRNKPGPLPRHAPACVSTAARHSLAANNKNPRRNRHACQT